MRRLVKKIIHLNLKFINIIYFVQVLLSEIEIFFMLKHLANILFSHLHRVIKS